MKHNSSWDGFLFVGFWAISVSQILPLVRTSLKDNWVPGQLQQQISTELHKSQHTAFPKTTSLGTSLVVQWMRIICQCRGHGFDTWPGKILHAWEKLSPCTTTTEAACFYHWSQWAQGVFSTAREANARKEVCSSPQEKAHLQQGRPSSTKKRKKHQRTPS